MVATIRNVVQYIFICILEEHAAAIDRGGTFPQNSVNIYQNTWHHISEDSNHQHMSNESKQKGK